MFRCSFLTSADGLAGGGVGAVVGEWGDGLSAVDGGVTPVIQEERREGECRSVRDVRRLADASQGVAGGDGGWGRAVRVSMKEGSPTPRSRHRSAPTRGTRWSSADVLDWRAAGWWTKRSSPTCPRASGLLYPAPLTPPPTPHAGKSTSTSIPRARSPCESRTAAASKPPGSASTAHRAELRVAMRSSAFTPAANAAVTSVGLSKAVLASPVGCRGHRAIPRSTAILRGTGPASAGPGRLPYGAGEKAKRAWQLR